MASTAHTYGPTCQLNRRDILLAESAGEEDAPPIAAQFFYSSPLPIDDPLSAIHIPTDTDANAKHAPRPFSAFDNGALEVAWRGLASETAAKAHRKPKKSSRGTATKALLGNYIGPRALRPVSPREFRDDMGQGDGPRSIRSAVSVVDQEEGEAAGVSQVSGTDDKAYSFPKEQRMAEKNLLRAQVKSSDTCCSIDEVVHQETLGSRDASQVRDPTAGHTDAGTTGRPFLRAPSHNSTASRPAMPQPVLSNFSQMSQNSEAPISQVDRSQKKRESLHVLRCKAHKAFKNQSEPEVLVGASRLHAVKLPSLQMTPIYWSPVHDVAAVTRGTWFYKETMYPVEASVANQLEAGYRELRPWSQTWEDELVSAMSVGSAGEEKITHRLWPHTPQVAARRRANSQLAKEEEQDHVDEGDYATDPFCAARCFHGEVAAEGTVGSENKPGGMTAIADIVQRYPESHVIYKDSLHAFILKPGLLPSGYYGRRPLSKIRKNITVGIPVVRGFDWKAWERLHPSKKTTSGKRAEMKLPTGSTDAGKKNTCPACHSERERPAVSDLVLVIHGIGQKLSERMESFHFTHAVNSFRRAVNMELANEGVQKVLRPDLGGLMVLPINWRAHLPVDAGGSKRSQTSGTAQDDKEFKLKDITPQTIPAVRNLISDVLLDVPYYLSQHKPAMIEALITEANRVYRLWCANNPEFHLKGRVHIIAHSLGSAMALDVLSKQPTLVPTSFDPKGKKIQKKSFEFNTTNLFFAGSPAGFFLLLDKGKLLPRNGKAKPDADMVDDTVKNITGHAGSYGCLAVDNLYNIIHYNDPIAYRLNATVDPMYAASLKDAEVPSSHLGWLHTISSAFQVLTPGGSTTTELGVGQLAPKPAIVRQPTQLEMEVHDFTREELAEKKFYLLNDNGQIDYFLSTGGGPLEIQYINMLGAHSSYWNSQDFIRMIVTEVGRKPGKSNALPNMKAMKKPHKKRPA